MFKKYQLKNGMNVLLVESHKSPVLSVQMWVKTGSADERAGEEGISHFIEHLVFKGSRKFKVGEVASTVEAAGGELNAYTSFDQTVFYVTISKEFQGVALDVISEMMGFPTFDPKEIDNEREVVIEEIKRSNDSPHRQASRLLFETLYKKHPYGIPVIGYPENIHTVSRDVLVDYFSSRYNPRTMTLIVAGDFSAPEMKKNINVHFGAFKKNKLRAVKRGSLKTVRKPTVVVKTAPFNETVIHIAFRTPKASHKDMAALDVLALIFGQGESSRLNRKLRMGSHVVNFAGASVFMAKDPGFMAISMSLNDKDLENALTELLNETVLLLSEPPTAEELQKALTNLASEQYYNLETVDGLARKYGHYQDLFGDPLYFERFMAKVQGLTPKDILAVARKYMVPENITMTVMTPAASERVEKAGKKWIGDLKSQLRKVGKTKPAAKKSGRATKVSWVFKKPRIAKMGVEKIELGKNVSLIVRPNFDTPVLSLKCASLGGSRLETSANQGAMELLSRVWTAGAGPYDEVQLNALTDEKAASLSAFGGRNTQGLSMSCLRPFAHEMIDLFFLMVRQPRFEDAALTREIKAMREHVKLRQDNPSQICILEFMREMFGDHPYGRDPYGSEEGISRLNRESINSIFQNQSHLTLVASGAVEVRALREQAEEALRGFKPQSGGLKTFPIAFPESDRQIFSSSKKEQSHILHGYPGLKMKDPERYALQVMQAILAGQGGRLFLELRDKASLAYSVSPMRMEGVEGGYFGAYIGCSPEKSGTAIKMMKVEFDKLVNVKVSDSELSRAQRYLIGKHDIELQKNSNITSSILFDDIYGVDFMETYRFNERIRAVTAKDIQLLAQKIFSRPSVTSLVGPTVPW